MLFVAFVVNFFLLLWSIAARPIVTNFLDLRPAGAVGEYVGAISSSRPCCTEELIGYLVRVRPECGVYGQMATG